MMAERARGTAEVHEFRALSNSYDSLLFLSDDDVRRSLDASWGERLADRWVPIRVRWSSPDFPVGDDTTTDFPGLQQIHVMSVRAADALGDLIEGRAELLPLAVQGGGEFYAVNVLRVSDAFDEQASEVKRFPSDRSRIMRIVRYEFEPARLEGETLFRLAQHSGRAYLTAPFVRRVKEAGLRGLSTDDPVWTSAEAKLSQSEAPGVGTDSG